MNADTITPNRIEALAELLKLAYRRMILIRLEVLDSDATPDEAAAEINEIIANINAANQ